MKSTTETDPRLTDEFVADWAESFTVMLRRLGAAERADFDYMPLSITFATPPANTALDLSRPVFYKELRSINDRPAIVYKVDGTAGFGLLQGREGVCDSVNDLEKFVRTVMEDAVSNGQGDDRFMNGRENLFTINRLLEFLIHPIGI